MSCNTNSLDNYYKSIEESEEIYIKTQNEIHEIDAKIQREINLQNELKVETQRLEEAFVKQEKEEIKLDMEYHFKLRCHHAIKDYLEEVEKQIESMQKQCLTAEADVDSTVETFISDVHKFHENLSVNNPTLSNLRLKMKEKTKTLALEQEIKRCELKFREDLMKDQEKLKEEFKLKSANLEKILKETSEQQQKWEDLRHESMKVMEECDSSQKEPKLRKFEDELESYEQEIDFLTASLLAMKKEKARLTLLHKEKARGRDNKSQDTPPRTASVLSSNLTMPYSDVNFFNPRGSNVQTFQRNLPQPSPIRQTTESELSEEDDARESELNNSVESNMEENTSNFSFVPQSLSTAPTSTSNNFTMRGIATSANGSRVSQEAALPSSTTDIRVSQGTASTSGTRFRMSNAPASLKTSRYSQAIAPRGFRMCKTPTKKNLYRGSCGKTTSSILRPPIRFPQNTNSIRIQIPSNTSGRGGPLTQVPSETTTFKFKEISVVQIDTKATNEPPKSTETQKVRFKNVCEVFGTPRKSS